LYCAQDTFEEKGSCFFLTDRDREYMVYRQNNHIPNGKIYASGLIVNMESMGEGMYK